MREMGSADDVRHPGMARPPDTRPLVAFDFDGTLTIRDSFIAFLVWRAGVLGAAIRGLTLIPAILGYIGHRDRGRLKCALIRAFLHGVSLDSARRDAQRFADEEAGRLFRPDARACWNAWRDRGAHLVIVTASPEFLVSPFADALEAERLIGTRLALDGHGRISGVLDGPNCRGPEKVTRLKAAFGAPLELAAAYGDTSGDTEMLAAAREAGFRVFKGRP